MPYHAAPHTVQELIVDMEEQVSPGQHIAYELNDDLTSDKQSTGANLGYPLVRGLG